MAEQKNNNQEEQKQEVKMKSQEHVPNERNRMKDKENLRK